MQSKKFDWILYYSDLWLKEDLAKKKKHEQRESNRETKGRRTLLR